MRSGRVEAPADHGGAAVEQLHVLLERARVGRLHVGHVRDHGAADNQGGLKVRPGIQRSTHRGGFTNSDTGVGKHVGREEMRKEERSGEEWRMVERG